MSAPLRVMLVDDHALVRSAVRQALAAPDIEIVGEAATAGETLLLAPQLQPDVLLLDINLPGTDGLRLVRELAPRLPETKIVMLTVSAARRDLIDAHVANHGRRRDRASDFGHAPTRSAGRGVRPG